MDNQDQPKTTTEEPEPRKIKASRKSQVREEEKRKAEVDRGRVMHLRSDKNKPVAPEKKDV